MHLAITRRRLLALTAVAAFAIACNFPSAYAQTGSANEFVKRFADELVRIVNGPEATAQKKAALGPVIDSNVDVARIARFCLGRFWSTATPAQQSEYTTLFHQVLLNEISGHLGDYRGVTYTMTGDTSQGDDTLVGTIINRPNAPSANVKWIVDSRAGEPKIVDVIAEGTSMRLTQRNDYASYLGQHGDSIDALIAALKKQLAAS